MVDIDNLPVDELKILLNNALNEIKDLRKQKSVEIREGLYTKTITRHGDKKHEHLHRISKNPEKVSLGWLGTIEIVCYPFTSVDRVFLRLGKQHVGVDKYNLPKLFEIHNRIKWFIENGNNVVKSPEDSKSPMAREVKIAWDHAYEMFKLAEQIRENAKQPYEVLGLPKAIWLMIKDKTVDELLQMGYDPAMVKTIKMFRNKEPSTDK